MVKKGHDIIPLFESEYTNFEVHELSSGNGFTDGINEELFFENSPNKDSISIKSFSFNSNSENKTHSTDTFIESAHNINIFQDNKFSTNEIGSIEPQNLSTSPCAKDSWPNPKNKWRSFQY